VRGGYIQSRLNLWYLGRLYLLYMSIYLSLYIYRRGGRSYVGAGRGVPRVRRALGGGGSKVPEKPSSLCASRTMVRVSELWPLGRTFFASRARGWASCT
jgi:hypothetical protein